MKSIRRVLRAMKEADERHDLIQNGDRIVVGVSGGKDSLVLLRALLEYRYYGKKEFEILPVFIDLGFGADIAPVKEWVSSLGLALEVDDSRFAYEVLKEHQGKASHLPCSICSRMKKAAICAAAKRLHAKKVAFAHHAEDAIETLFLNMVHGSRIATFAPRMELRKAGVTFLRPLYLAREEDIRRCAEEEGLPVMKSRCPADGFTDREKMKEFLRNAYSLFPEAKDNFLSMLYNAGSLYLPYEDERLSWRDHRFALRPIRGLEDVPGTTFAKRRRREGEEGYLILGKGRPAGEILVREEGARKYSIRAPKGGKEALLFAIDYLENKIARSINPVTIYLSARKGIPEEAGYAPLFDGRKGRTRMGKVLQRGRTF